MRKVDLKKESTELQEVLANVPDSFYEAIQRAAAMLNAAFKLRFSIVRSLSLF